MKKIIAITTICILCTSTLVFASNLNILKKGNTEYIPLKKVIQKSGGKIQDIKDGIDIKVDGKNVIIEKNSSFAKIGKEYYPLNQKKLNGFNVPVDTKPLYQDNDIYIAKGFLKDNNLVEYTISKDKIIINSHENSQSRDEVLNQTTNKEEQENSTQKPIKPETTPPTKPETTKPTRPSRPNTGNNNNSNNNSGNNNQENGGDSTTDNEKPEENNGNENGNAGSGNENESSGNAGNSGDSNESNIRPNPVEPGNPDSVANQIQ